MRKGHCRSRASAQPISAANIDQELGVSIVRHMLMNPARTILMTVGEDSSVTVSTLVGQYGGMVAFTCRVSCHLVMLAHKLYIITLPLSPEERKAVRHDKQHRE